MSADSLLVPTIHRWIGHPSNALINEPFDDPHAMPTIGPSFRRQTSPGCHDLLLAAGGYIGVDG
jgi:hypothetical protein